MPRRSSAAAQGRSTAQQSEGDCSEVLVVPTTNLTKLSAKLSERKRMSPAPFVEMGLISRIYARKDVGNSPALRGTPCTSSSSSTGGGSSSSNYCTPAPGQAVQLVRQPAAEPQGRRRAGRAARVVTGRPWVGAPGPSGAPLTSVCSCMRPAPPRSPGFRDCASPSALLPLLPQRLSLKSPPPAAIARAVLGPARQPGPPPDTAGAPCQPGAGRLSYPRPRFCSAGRSTGPGTAQQPPLLGWGHGVALCSERWLPRPCGARCHGRLPSACACGGAGHLHVPARPGL